MFPGQFSTNHTQHAGACDARAKSGWRRCAHTTHVQHVNMLNTVECNHYCVGVCLCRAVQCAAVAALGSVQQQHVGRDAGVYTPQHKTICTHAIFQGILHRELASRPQPTIEWKTYNGRQRARARESESENVWPLKCASSVFLGALELCAGAPHDECEN